ncbi:MAG: hypothetical protein QM736_11025 [Vicinamibacterales bacterium]
MPPVSPRQRHRLFGHLNVDVERDVVVAREDLEAAARWLPTSGRLRLTSR